MNIFIKNYIGVHAALGAIYKTCDLFTYKEQYANSPPIRNKLLIVSAPFVGAMIGAAVGAFFPFSYLFVYSSYQEAVEKERTLDKKELE